MTGQPLAVKESTILGSVHRPTLGHAAAKLIDIESAELYDLAVMLGARLEAAEPIWVELRALGYIEEAPDNRYVPTAKMAELATKPVKPALILTSARARQLMTQVIYKANSLNRKAEFKLVYHYVKKLVVLRSGEISEKSLSLDMAWVPEIRPKLSLSQQRDLSLDLSIKADTTQGATAWLGGSDPFLRLVKIGSLDELKDPYHVVYEFEPPPPEEP